MPHAAHEVAPNRAPSRDRRDGAGQETGQGRPKADHLQVLAQLRYLVDNPKAPAPFRSRVLADADALLELA